MSVLRRFSVLRAALTTGGATLLSRLTGFARDVALAGMMGAGPTADIFVVAFRLPNLFRRLFAEGAFSAAFVPLYTEKAARDADPKITDNSAARVFAGDVFAVLVILLLLFTLAALYFMPYLVRALAAGFVQDAAQFMQAVYYARLAFPYLACMSLMALFAAMLNTSGRFLAGALAPILLNLVLLAALWLAHIHGRAPLDYVIGGVVVAGVLQLLCVVGFAYRAGLRIGLRRPRLTDDVRRFGRLALPGIFAAGVGQINLLVGTSIATFQTGAAAWLYYADRLYQLPMGVIGVALGIALLPDLARRLAAHDVRGAWVSLDRALLAAMLFILPSAVGLAQLAEPAVRVLFERGAFTRADSLATAQAVQIFCLGLPAFVLVRILQPAFFARHDTRAPLIDSALGVACNIALSLLLFGWLGHVAIALATAIAGWLTAGLMLIRLWRRGIWWLRVSVALRLMRQVLAAGVMLAAIYVLADFWLPQGGFIAHALWLGGQVAVGALVYFLVALGARPHAALRALLATPAGKRDKARID